MKTTLARKSSLALLATLALGLLAGCANKAEPRYPPKELQRFEASAELATDWRQRVGQGLGRATYPIAPSLEGDVVFAADERGRVMAFNARSGERRWQTDLDVGVSSGLTAAAGQVYLGTRNGEVLALSQADGDVTWRARVSSEVLAPPQPNQQLLVVQSVDGTVTALDRRSGEERWVHTVTEPSLTLRGTGTPSVIDPVTFAGFANGRLVTLDNRSGQPLWERRIAVPRGRSEIDRMVDLSGQPVLTPDGRLFVTSYNGRLVALEAPTGDVLWESELSSYHTPVLVGDRLFTVNEASHVIAFDARTGEELWRSSDLEGRWLTSPAFADGSLVVGDFEGYLHLIDAQTGRFTARTRVDSSGISVRPITDFRRIYVLANNGRLEALEIKR
ncbi:outer membrane protein assembly factor BamB [Billgrantia kenyensis]|uniref:Outer membrane protein assembly factor BamB n=1 Tax=Billgrantia kenyensis TaxID=321266 RepID=A0A7W0AE77_9GAMM|nr:outer membrane protein assembly factor BamB [Halomonas kenyensis]MBA2779379.1 outer membrane protein assembly factor BamB [Halomonas kenyensis]MCG6662473.1 outer membrane protein assembly factor BamB [Halomonas kenyensis]